MTTDIFELKVDSRNGVLYQGRVMSVTSFNATGKFDVLAQHANFISLIAKKLIISNDKGEIKEIPFNDALIRVRQNNVEVYIGVEGLSESQY
jgi:F0F1-type ATP synthase epsilon subunit